MLVVAGHSFDLSGRCSCGRKWTQIMDTTADQIGEDGVAHIGKLTATEFESIVTHREYERNWIWSALIGVATGSGPVYTSQEVGSEPEDSDPMAW